ncbi:MAG: hypothetical protein V4677_08560 [Bacteroidota bacterium]
MIKHIVSGIVTVFLVSCTQVNTTGEKTITQGDDTIGEVDISLSKMDAVEELSNIEEPANNKILFKASGTEPGWFAEISQTQIRLVLDYGKDSLITENQGALINEENDYNYTINDNISISALKKPCNTASGDKADRQVTISYKGKKHTGCGSFVK